MKNSSYWSLMTPARRSNHLSQVMLALALILSSRQAAAGVPDWLRVAARLPMSQHSEETDAVRLVDERILTISDNGEMTALYRKAYRILRPQGRRHALVSVYQDTETSISSLKGWGIPAQGAEYEVKEKDAIETAALGESLYNDTRYKLLKIPGAEPGNTIGLEYEIRRRPMILQDMWSSQDEIPAR